jgi:miniconductance mechanosensitive channel
MERLAGYHHLLPDLVVIGGLIAVALLAYWIADRVLVSALRAFARRTTHTWDDALIDHHVAGRLAQLVPAFIIYLGIDILPRVDADLEKVLLNVTSAYMILIVTFTVTAILGAANTIYEAQPRSRQRPIKGFVQLVQLIIWIIGIILFVAALMDRSPVLLLSGFGAATAVLMLVFKDTLLSLVASVQLNAQDMVHVGDWIEMPQFGADGDVIDVQLHTVKVQNWDKTITTIPTHRLISDSFRNWRGMSESGGRRIKRALYLDAATVHFLAPGEIEHCRRFALLQEYLAGKESELAEYNRTLSHQNADAAINQRRLTNIGTFRAYAYAYLQGHPRIHRGMTLLVRQLPPGPEGIPIEIYCFTNTTNWNEYEGIQADIFDHLLAIVPEFGLRIYQHPSGTDLQRLSPAGDPRRA